jgi:tricarballylate dehydrogenase
LNRGVVHRVDRNEWKELMSLINEPCDVVIVGAGNAALSAALTAVDNGARVLVLERSAESDRGGNTRFTAGGMRFAYDSADEVIDLIGDLTEEEIAKTDFGSYSEEQFFADVARITQYRADPDLAHLLVTKSKEAVFWLRDHAGVRFLPSYRRFAFLHENRYTFWGGVAVESTGGGPGLVEAETATFLDRGGRTAYDARAVELLYDGRRIEGVRVHHDGAYHDVRAESVVIASGGFQANRAWRAQYLGAGYDLARVRGTWTNTGDGIRMAMEIGAVPFGHWSGAHAVPWDLNAPEFGDLRVGDGFSKLSYPLGIMVNVNGDRFVDEAADFRTYTYAKYGHEVLRQPNQVAWQIFDDKVSDMLRDEYRIKQATRVRADTIEELVRKMEGVAADRVLHTIKEYNERVDDDTSYNPNVKDGRSSATGDLAKSNWATRLDTPPYSAFAVTCGVTFTFGGLRIDEHARVMAAGNRPIEGLYAAGETVGGIFYHNYPGGSGLTAGTVFGRIAGASATNR